MLLDVTPGRWRTTGEFVCCEFVRGSSSRVVCPSVQSSAICYLMLRVDAGARRLRPSCLPDGQTDGRQTIGRAGLAVDCLIRLLIDKSVDRSRRPGVR